MLGAVVVLFAAWVVALRQRSGDRGGEPPDEPFSGWLLRRRFSRLLVVLVASFAVLVFVFWSIGNSDPINTRFLFPGYLDYDFGFRVGASPGR